MALKMHLSNFITDCIKKMGLKQHDAAAKLNVTQSRISDLANGKIEKFTLDAMMDMLDKLGFRTSLTLPRTMPAPFLRSSSLKRLATRPDTPSCEARA